MKQNKAVAYWAPFLHFYQPPTQDYHVLKEINDTCYEPLFNMLLENIDFKLTMNMNSVLIDLLRDHGLSHTVGLLKELVARKQVEIVGSGKYHPILPLVPKKEVLHQIALQETDLSREFPGWTRSGFFPPEMAVSPGLVSLLGVQGYTWVLSSGIACPSNWAYDKVYQSPEGVNLFFRDDIISNEISFKKISVDFFIDKLKILYKGPHYIITAQDGETFGHHVRDYEKTFLQHAMQDAVDDELIDICLISDLQSYFPTAHSQVRVLSSSWSTSQDDLDSNNPYPLWNHGDNEVHRIQYKFLKNVLELVYVLEDMKDSTCVQEAKTTRYFLDQGLHSCQFWWASAAAGKWYMWSPNMAMKGADLLLRAAFNARLAIINMRGDQSVLAKSEELFDQITQYYSLLLMELTNYQQKITGKKNGPESFFDNLFTADEDSYKQLRKY